MLPMTSDGAEAMQQQRLAPAASGLKWILVPALLLVLFCLPLALSIRFVGLFTVMGIFVVAAVGLQITTGYAGQVNMGQSAFVGMGAYTAAALASHLRLPFWVTIPTGGV